MTKRTDTRRGSQRLPAVLAAVLMLSGPGCASLQLINMKSDKIAMADAEHPAIEVLAVWQAAEGPGLGGIPTRGFAGQIFFFTQDRAQPVAVDGKARIYVFDDHGTVQDQAKPLRQFDFERQSWAAHLQTSKLGPTYGVFIPYPREDYHQAVCSLRIRFTPLKGRPLFSASSTIVLPGPAIAAASETTQKSPLDQLAKKLQAQQQGPRSWTNASLNTEPRTLNGGPQPPATQLPPTQMPAGIAQLPAAGQAVLSVGAYSPAAGAPNGYAPTGYGPTSYAMNPPQFAAGVNPIVQTSGTAGQMGALVESPETAAYTSVGATDIPQPSGRIKLQAVTNGNPVSAADESGNAGDFTSSGSTSGPLTGHSRHPLAD
jgi:hypothetical protein